MKVKVSLKNLICVFGLCITVLFGYYVTAYADPNVSTGVNTESNEVILENPSESELSITDSSNGLHFTVDLNTEQYAAYTDFNSEIVFIVKLYSEENNYRLTLNANNNYSVKLEPEPGHYALHAYVENDYNNNWSLKTEFNDFVYPSVDGKLPAEIVMKLEYDKVPELESIQAEYDKSIAETELEVTEIQDETSSVDVSEEETSVVDENGEDDSSVSTDELTEDIEQNDSNLKRMTLLKNTIFSLSLLLIAGIIYLFVKKKRDSE